MLSTIDHLASDGLAGRYTLSPDLPETAAWLAKRYADAGLVPVGDDYLVPFALTIGAKTTTPAELHTTRIRRGSAGSAGSAGSPKPVDGAVFSPMPMSGSGSVTAPAVFVGYAAQSDPGEDGSVAYDDLAGVDLHGKIAVALLDAPGQPDFRALFRYFERVAVDYAEAAKSLLEAEDEDGMRALHRRSRDRIAEAIRPFTRGKPIPEAFFEVDDPMVAELDLMSMLSPLMRMSRDAQGPRFGRGVSTGAKARRLVEAGAVGVVFVRGPNSFIGSEAREEDALEELRPEPPKVSPEPVSIPVLQMRWKAADSLFRVGRRKLSAAQKKIDESLSPLHGELGLELTLKTELEPIQIEIPNVVAKLPGTDLADELVVFGAHYDHIGTAELGDCREIERKNDAICNGADDNASGTAMVLELATALAESDQKPRRTLVFSSFAGEELGLLGSEALADDPPFDMASVKAMVNLDMVGRYGRKGLAIGGLSTSAEWMPLLDELGPRGLSIIYERSVTSRSDHANFFTKKVPVLFFFTGTHSDYHRAGDHVEKINVDGLQQIGELVSDLMLELADGRPIAWREPPEGEGLQSRLPGADEATIEKRVEAKSADETPTSP
jgi:hypothetical protein